jgi:3-oxoacyl-[acyl-carrier protein] reductase
LSDYLQRNRNFEKRIEFYHIKTRSTFMNLNLSGKNALVCGSTQGLGLAIAKELSMLGANITLMARNEDKLKSVVDELDCKDGQTHGYLVADFSSSDHVAASIQGNIQSGQIFHILVNNTGGPAGGKAIDANPNQFLSAFESHLICNQILTQAVVPGMKQSGFGRIINVISTSVKQPIAGLGVSNTIRAAVANWSKTLSVELAPFGITVNNVLPGFTQTVRADYIVQKKASDSGKTTDEIMSELVKEIPAGRIGQPEEFGAAVAFLCSPAAGYINGINLPVDGGRTGCL